MITKEELISIGFKIKGEQENDPFYQVNFEQPFSLQISRMSGQLYDNGEFEIYGMREKYSNIEKIKELFQVLNVKLRKQRNYEK